MSTERSKDCRQNQAEQAAKAAEAQRRARNTAIQKARRAARAGDRDDVVQRDIVAAEDIAVRQQQWVATAATPESNKRAANAARQKACREAKAARDAHICKFCGVEGHEPISRQSCHIYCHHCDIIGHASSVCPVHAEEESRRIRINHDAANYKEALDGTMVFYTCALCEVEHGLALMIALADVADKIAATEVKALHEKLVAPLHDPGADGYSRAFAHAASSEMVDGLLIGATHVCRQCVSDLSDKKFAPTTADGLRKAPRRALVNGYFRGKTPAVLSALNRTEISLLSLVNVLTTVVMLGQHCTYHGRATAFAVMNDVAEVAEVVPRKADIAIIRTDTSSSPKSLRYNPQKVLNALIWLQQNNPLYKDKLQLPLLPDGTLDPVWLNGGIDASLEIEHISATADDYAGCENVDEAPSGEDGHPVNPGAPDSGTTVVLLHSSTEHSSHGQQIAAIVQKRTAVMTRKRGEYVPDYDTEFFLAQAFPQLFPYGRGCPNITGNVSFDGAYIQHTLHLGRYRSFQQCPSYIFYAYTWWIRRKIGTISFLVDRAGGADNATLTVADAQKFLAALSSAPTTQVEAYMEKKDVRYLLDRMKPYANELPGSEMYFARERKKLMAIISSPVTTTEGQWAWFFTEAQPDLYLAEIYDNAISSAIHDTTKQAYLPWDATLAQRQARADSLTKAERETVLRDHPFMSARIHSLQQVAFWKHVLGGEDKPLGEIVDYWCRVEFQMKGTPHWHCLVNVSKKSLNGIHANSVISEDSEEQEKVKDLVAAASTAILLRRDQLDTSELPANEARAQLLQDEKSWYYNIDRPRYFADIGHPSRHRFQAAGRDYFMSKAGRIDDAYVRLLYRRLQFANQFHLCRPSCHKYCRNNEKICRFDFPRAPIDKIQEEVVIVKDKDRRNRTRVKVHAQRNNGNMNVHLRSPLCLLSGRGNQDIQYIHNTVGGAEYVSKYCSKAEKSESTALQNAINRKLAEYAIRSNMDTGANMSFLQKLRAVGNAVAAAQQIGAVHACYVLGKIPLVKSSRFTLNINVLRRKELDQHTIVTDEEELARMNEDESALLNTPGTLLGTRDAYHALYKQQIAAHDSTDVTFFAFLSAYRVKQAPATGHEKARKEPPHLHVDEHGFIEAPTSFILGEVLYTAMTRTAVLCLVPHIAVDESNERSAFSILLLYGKWPPEGESHLAVPTAVAALAAAKATLPAYVLVSLQKRRRSEELLAETGEPCIDDDLCQAAGTQEDNTEFEARETPRQCASIQAAPFAADTARFTYSAEPAIIMGCMAFVDDLKERMSANRQPRAFTLTDEEKALRAADKTLYIPLRDSEARDAELDALAVGLNTEQRCAFDTASEHISGVSGRQMIMFVSGEGGTGKSRLIHAVTLFAQIHVGKTEGSWGPVLKTAPTGGAAYNIGGSTWHSALGRGGMASLKITDAVPDTAVAALRGKALGTTLFILDELSLVSAEDLFEINRRLQAATGVTTALFGGLHVLLAGDFYQMKTVQGVSLVALITGNFSPEARRGRAIMTTGLSDFCMLKHNVRAQQGNGELSPLAKFTREARPGNVHNGILHLLNDRVVNNVAVAMRRAHKAALWITSTHEKVAQINAYFQQQRIDNNEQMVTIIARHTPDKFGTPAPDTPEILDQLYSTSGSRKGGRSDLMVSYMVLFVGSRVRLIRNLFVEAGLYNGAMGTVWGFVYRGSGPPQQAGKSRRFCDMTEHEREAPIVLVQMDGDNASIPYTCIPGVPRIVPIVEQQSQQLVEARIVVIPAVLVGTNVLTPAVTETFKYRRHQLPLLPAEARTAHSVQGYTAAEGVVVDPGSKFFAGDYTAISRATSKDKVLLLAPLQESSFTRDPGYRRLVDKEYDRLLTAFPQ